jgi:hypothetical protein
MRPFARCCRLGAVAILAVVSLVLLIESKSQPITASAASDPNFQDIERFQCVTEVGPAQTDADSPFTPAVYRTVINVYNPQDFEVQFTKKAVVARSQRSPRGVISQPQIDTLLPGAAVGIDCVDIQTLLGGLQPVGNGDLVIEARHTLKVIPAYTQLVPPLT